MTKFNLKETTSKLGEIMSAKAPAVPIAKEKFKQAVLDNLPKAKNADTEDFMNHLGIEKLDTPEAGLKAKMNYWKEKDFSVQERIMFAQSWNLAVQLVSGIGIKKEKGNEDVATTVKEIIEFWQKYFYQQLKNQNGK